MLTAEPDIKNLDAQPNTQKDGGRRWMYPLVRKGKFYKYREWLSYAYLVLFFAGPFIRIGGHPALLINIIERRFVLLGQVFWPQDFFIFVLAMLVSLVGIIVFAIAFGRIFCGWICPQTIFMEMVFRRIEIWIEGNPKQRRKLDESPWTREKIIKKSAKHSIFFLLSFLIANTFLSYIIGSEQLLKIITEPITQHWIGFLSIVLFTTAFFLVYSQMRELVCTVICPYGRLQGVLTDKHTLIVAYNYLRGEPRGKRLRYNDNANKGDCVDCGLCVDVCPTGIDIRKGTQLECVNCTLCIDACNEVMDKINRPRNLIGFYSEEMIKENKKPTFTPRMMGYSAVIVILTAALTWFVLQRTDVDASILRSPGLTYQEMPGGYISNLYNADLINKTDKPQNINLVSTNPDVKIKFVQKHEVIEKEGSANVVFFLVMPQKQIKDFETHVTIQVKQGDKVLNSINTTFIGPPNN
jgi:cytochrome c oxidase accessory protein FixG